MRIPNISSLYLNSLLWSKELEEMYGVQRRYLNLEILGGRVVEYDWLVKSGIVWQYKPDQNFLHLTVGGNNHT